MTGISLLYTYWEILLYVHYMCFLFIISKIMHIKGGEKTKDYSSLVNWTTDVCDDCFSSMYSIIMELRELQNSKFLRRNSKYLDVSIVVFYTKIKIIIIFDAKKTILLIELKVPVHVPHVRNKVTNFLLHSPIPTRSKQVSTTRAVWGHTPKESLNSRTIVNAILGTCNLIFLAYVVGTWK